MRNGCDIYGVQCGSGGNAINTQRVWEERHKLPRAISRGIHLDYSAFCNVDLEGRVSGLQANEWNTQLKFTFQNVM